MAVTGGVIYANGADADGSILKGRAGDDSLRGNNMPTIFSAVRATTSYLVVAAWIYSMSTCSDIKDGTDTDTLLDLELSRRPGWRHPLA
jgi:hypothetical protein